MSCAERLPWYDENSLAKLAKTESNRRRRGKEVAWPVTIARCTIICSAH